MTQSDLTWHTLPLWLRVLIHLLAGSICALLFMTLFCIFTVAVGLIQYVPSHICVMLTVGCVLIGLCRGSWKLGTWLGEQYGHRVSDLMHH